MSKTMQFKEFVKLQRGFDLPNSNRKNGIVPVVASTGISGYHNEYKVNAPGVVTGRSGSLGTVQYITQNFWPLNTTLWVKDFKGNWPKYVYYYLQTMKLEQYNSGAGVPTLNRNDLDVVNVNIHNYCEQQKIANVLSAYDDLIENNNRRIVILEEMAQKLYREWFVHFRFPGHENCKMVESELGKIPEGWEIGYLSDIAYNYRKSINKNHRHNYQYYLPIDCIPKKSFALSEVREVDEAESSLIEFKKNDIVMGAMRVYFHKVICAPFDGITRSTCFVIRPRNAVFHAYLLMTIFQDSSIEYANTVSVGATMPYVVWDTFAQMKTVIPPTNIAQKYNEIVKPILRQINNIFYKNTNLRKTRDLLLPALINGDIDVSELDIKVKEE